MMNWGENNHYKIPLLEKAKHNKDKKNKQKKTGYPGVGVLNLWFIFALSIFCLLFVLKSGD